MPVLTPHVPSGLIDLMKDLAKEVLREKPENIYDFAALHFEKLIQQRDGSLDKDYEQFVAFEAHFDGQQRFAIPANSGFICQRPIQIQPIIQPKKSKSEMMAGFKAMESINEEDVLVENLYTDEKYQKAIYAIQRYYRRYAAKKKNFTSTTLTATAAAIIIQRTMRRLFANKVKVKAGGDTAKRDGTAQEDVDNVSEAASYTSSSTIQMLADSQEGRENRLPEREEVIDGGVDDVSTEFKEQTTVVQDEPPLAEGNSKIPPTTEVDRKSIADENGNSESTHQEETIPNHTTIALDVDDTSTAPIGILSAIIGSNDQQNSLHTNTVEIDSNSSEPTQITTPLDTVAVDKFTFNFPQSLGTTPDTLPASSPLRPETQETFAVRLQGSAHTENNTAYPFKSDVQVRKFDPDTGESLKIYDVFYQDDPDFSDSLNESTMERDSLENEDLDVDSLESNENVTHVSGIVKREVKQDDGSLYGDADEVQQEEEQNVHRLVEFERVPTYLYGIHPSRSPAVERRNVKSRKSAENRKIVDVVNAHDISDRSPEEKSEEESLESKESTSEESSATQIENILEPSEEHVIDGEVEKDHQTESTRVHELNGVSFKDLEGKAASSGPEPIESKPIADIFEHDSEKSETLTSDDGFKANEELELKLNEGLSSTLNAGKHVSVADSQNPSQIDEMYTREAKPSGQTEIQKIVDSADAELTESKTMTTSSVDSTSYKKLEDLLTFDGVLGPTVASADLNQKGNDLLISSESNDVLLEVDIPTSIDHKGKEEKSAIDAEILSKTEEDEHRPKSSKGTVMIKMETPTPQNIAHEASREIVSVSEDKLLKDTDQDGDQAKKTTQLKEDSLKINAHELARRPKEVSEQIESVTETEDQKLKDIALDQIETSHDQAKRTTHLEESSLKINAKEIAQKPNDVLDQIKSVNENGDVALKHTIIDNIETTSDQAKTIAQLEGSSKITAQDRAQKTNETSEEIKSVREDGDLKDKASHEIGTSQDQAKTTTHLKEGSLKTNVQEDAKNLEIKSVNEDRSEALRPTALDEIETIDNPAKTTIHLRESSLKIDSENLTQKPNETLKGIKSGSEKNIGTTNDQAEATTHHSEGSLKTITQNLSKKPNENTKSAIEDMALKDAVLEEIEILHDPAKTTTSRKKRSLDVNENVSSDGQVHTGDLSYGLESITDSVEDSDEKTEGETKIHKYDSSIKTSLDNKSQKPSNSLKVETPDLRPISPLGYFATLYSGQNSQRSSPIPSGHQDEAVAAQLFELQSLNDLYPGLEIKDIISEFHSKDIQPDERRKDPAHDNNNNVESFEMKNVEVGSEDRVFSEDLMKDYMKELFKDTSEDEAEKLLVGNKTMEVYEPSTDAMLVSKVETKAVVKPELSKRSDVENRAVPPSSYEAFDIIVDEKVGPSSHVKNEDFEGQKSSRPTESLLELKDDKAPMTPELLRNLETELISSMKSTEEDDRVQKDGQYDVKAAIVEIGSKTVELLNENVVPLPPIAANYENHEILDGDEARNALKTEVEGSPANTQLEAEDYFGSTVGLDKKGGNSTIDILKIEALGPQTKDILKITGEAKLPKVEEEPKDSEDFSEKVEYSICEPGFKEEKHTNKTDIIEQTGLADVQNDTETAQAAPKDQLELRTEKPTSPNAFEETSLTDALKSYKNSAKQRILNFDKIKSEDDDRLINKTVAEGDDSSEKLEVIPNKDEKESVSGVDNLTEDDSSFKKEGSSDIEIEVKSEKANDDKLIIKMMVKRDDSSQELKDKPKEAEKGDSVFKVENLTEDDSTVIKENSSEIKFEVQRAKGHKLVTMKIDSSEKLEEKPTKVVSSEESILKVENHTDNDSSIVKEENMELSDLEKGKGKHISDISEQLEVVVESSKQFVGPIDTKTSESLIETPSKAFKESEFENKVDLEPNSNLSPSLSKTFTKDDSKVVTNLLAEEKLKMVTDSLESSNLLLESDATPEAKPSLEIEVVESIPAKELKPEVEAQVPETTDHVTENLLSDTKIGLGVKVSEANVIKDEARTTERNTSDKTVEYKQLGEPSFEDIATGLSDSNNSIEPDQLSNVLEVKVLETSLIKDETDFEATATEEQHIGGDEIETESIDNEKLDIEESITEAGLVRVKSALEATVSDINADIKSIKFEELSDGKLVLETKVPEAPKLASESKIPSLEAKASFEEIESERIYDGQLALDKSIKETIITEGKPVLEAQDRETNTTPNHGEQAVIEVELIKPISDDLDQNGTDYKHVFGPEERIVKDKPDLETDTLVEDIQPDHSKARELINLGLPNLESDAPIENVQSDHIEAHHLSGLPIDKLGLETLVPGESIQFGNIKASEVEEKINKTPAHQLEGANVNTDLIQAEHQSDETLSKTKRKTTPTDQIDSVVSSISVPTDVTSYDDSNAETSADFSSIGKDLDFFEDTINYLKSATTKLGTMEDIFDDAQSKEDLPGEALTKTEVETITKSGDDLRKAAVIIQSAVRGYQARKAMKEDISKMRFESKKLQSEVAKESKIAPTAGDLLNHSAIVIQSAIRGFRVRRALKKEKIVQENGGLPQVEDNSGKKQVPVAVIHPTEQLPYPTVVVHLADDLLDEGKESERKPEPKPPTSQKENQSDNKEIESNSKTETAPKPQQRNIEEEVIVKQVVRPATLPPRITREKPLERKQRSIKGDSLDQTHNDPKAAVQPTKTNSKTARSFSLNEAQQAKTSVRHKKTLERKPNSLDDSKRLATQTVKNDGSPRVAKDPIRPLSSDKISESQEKKKFVAKPLERAGDKSKPLKSKIPSSSNPLVRPRLVKTKRDQFRRNGRSMSVNERIQNQTFDLEAIKKELLSKKVKTPPQSDRKHKMPPKGERQEKAIPKSSKSLDKHQSSLGKPSKGNNIVDTDNTSMDNDSKTSSKELPSDPLNSDSIQINLNENELSMENGALNKPTIITTETVSDTSSLVDSLKEEVNKLRSVIKIQKTFRGFIARKNLKKKRSVPKMTDFDASVDGVLNVAAKTASEKNALSEVNTSNGDSDESNPRPREEGEKEASETLGIFDSLKRDVEDLKKSALDKSATTIQKTFRGYKTRKDLKADLSKARHSDQMIIEGNKISNDAAKSHKSDQVLNDSALGGTQKQVSEGKPELETKETASDTPSISDSLKRDVEDFKKSALDKSATTIQKTFRGYKTRKDLKADLSKVRHSNQIIIEANKISNDAVKSRKSDQVLNDSSLSDTRKQVSEEKSEFESKETPSDTLSISNSSKKDVEDFKKSALDKSATTIQKTFRGYKTRKDLKADLTKARHSDQTITEANSIPNDAAKSNTILNDNALDFTQKQASEGDPELGGKETASDTPSISDSLKRDVEDFKKSALDKSATTIQKTFRGYKTRKDLKTDLTKARHSDQTILEANSIPNDAAKSHKSDQVLNDSALSDTRKQVSEEKSEFESKETPSDTLSISNSSKKDVEDFKKSALDKSATTIQKTFRGYRTRKNVSDNSEKRSEAKTYKDDAKSRGTSMEESKSETKGDDNDDEGLKVIDRFDVEEYQNSALQKSATTIQKTFRGYKTRRDLLRKDKPSEELKESERLVADVGDETEGKQADKTQNHASDFEDKESTSGQDPSLNDVLEKAAVTIQKTYKGFKTRKDGRLRKRQQKADENSDGIPLNDISQDVSKFSKTLSEENRKADDDVKQQGPDCTLNGHRKVVHEDDPFEGVKPTNETHLFDRSIGGRNIIKATSAGALLEAAASTIQKAYRDYHNRKDSISTKVPIKSYSHGAQREKVFKEAVENSDESSTFLGPDTSFDLSDVESVDAKSEKFSNLERLNSTDTSTLVIDDEVDLEMPNTPTFAMTIHSEEQDNENDSAIVNNENSLSVNQGIRRKRSIMDPTAPSLQDILNAEEFPSPDQRPQWYVGEELIVPTDLSPETSSLQNRLASSSSVEKLSSIDARNENLKPTPSINSAVVSTSSLLFPNDSEMHDTDTYTLKQLNKHSRAVSANEEENRSEEHSKVKEEEKESKEIDEIEENTEKEKSEAQDNEASLHGLAITKKISKKLLSSNDPFAVVDGTEKVDTAEAIVTELCENCAAGIHVEHTTGQKCRQAVLSKEIENQVANVVETKADSDSHFDEIKQFVLMEELNSAINAVTNKDSADVNEMDGIQNRDDTEMSTLNEAHKKQNENETVDSQMSNIQSDPSVVTVKVIGQDNKEIPHEESGYPSISLIPPSSEDDTSDRESTHESDKKSAASRTDITVRNVESFDETKEGKVDTSMKTEHTDEHFESEILEDEANIDSKKVSIDMCVESETTQGDGKKERNASEIVELLESKAGAAIEEDKNVQTDGVDKGIPLEDNREQTVKETKIQVDTTDGGEIIVEKSDVVKNRRASESQVQALNEKDGENKSESSGERTEEGAINMKTEEDLFAKDQGFEDNFDESLKTSVDGKVVIEELIDPVVQEPLSSLLSADKSNESSQSNDQELLAKDKHNDENLENVEEVHSTPLQDDKTKALAVNDALEMEVEAFEPKDADYNMKDLVPKVEDKNDGEKLLGNKISVNEDKNLDVVEPKDEAELLDSKDSVDQGTEKTNQDKVLDEVDKNLDDVEINDVAKLSDNKDEVSEKVRRSLENLESKADNPEGAVENKTEEPTSSEKITILKEETNVLGDLEPKLTKEDSREVDMKPTGEKVRLEHSNINVSLESNKDPIKTLADASNEKTEGPGVDNISGGDDAKDIAPMSVEESSTSKTKEEKTEPKEDALDIKQDIEFNLLEGQVDELQACKDDIAAINKDVIDDLEIASKIIESNLSNFENSNKEATHAPEDVKSSSGEQKASSTDQKEISHDSKEKEEKSLQDQPSEDQKSPSNTEKEIEARLDKLIEDNLSAIESDATLIPQKDLPIENSTDEVDETPCVKKIIRRAPLSTTSDPDESELESTTTKEDSTTTTLAYDDASENDVLEIPSTMPDTLESMTEKLSESEAMVARMHQRRASEHKASIDSTDQPPSFDEPICEPIKPMQELQKSSSTEVEDDIILQRLQRGDTTRESSAQSESIIYGDTTTQLTESDDTFNENLDLKTFHRMNTIAADRSSYKPPGLLLKSVTIDDTVKYIEPEKSTEESGGSFCMDDVMSADVRKKMMAYSISEADSDYYEPEERTSRPHDDFNISTALDTSPSSDTDTTIISAATKIQAGARGFLTRRRLRRASMGTKSSLTEETKRSFGNEAIGESLDRLVEEEVGKRMPKVQYHRQVGVNSLPSALGDSDEREIAHLPPTCEEVHADDDSVDLKLAELTATLSRPHGEYSSIDGQREKHNVSTSSENDVNGRSETEDESAQVSSNLEATLAARRLTLQRGDAMRNDSTPDDDNSNGKQVDPAKNIPSTTGTMLIHQKTMVESTTTTTTTTTTTERRNYSDAATTIKMDKIKWFAMRQNSMPVQIDSEVFRVLPKHMRKRIKSAEGEKKKRIRLPRD